MRRDEPDASRVHRVSDLPPPARWGNLPLGHLNRVRKAQPAGPDRRRCEREGGKQMKDFSGRIAVVTGGGSGMGRELVRLLVAEGCAIAMCDVSSRGMAETQHLCEAAGLPQGLRFTSHVADVSNEADVLRFRDEVSAQHSSDHIHLLFNNAGISGGGSMIVNERTE
jgi:hypothetical protein